jgi:hypothetical protein
VIPTIIKYLLFIFSFSIITSCGAKLLLPTQTDVNRVLVKYPNYTWSELMAGKSIYESNWRRPRDPASRSEEEWIQMVPNMVKRVNKKARKEKIDSKGQELLLKYLVTMSKVPKVKKTAEPFY